MDKATPDRDQPRVNLMVLIILDNGKNIGNKWILTSHIIANHHTRHMAR